MKQNFMQSSPNNIVDIISDQITISQFIQQYVKLTKRGANYIGLCPFHAEKTPSFTVNDNKKFFYCFGCKESGGVIQFSMKYNNISFKEAIEMLASYAGITLNQQTYKKLSAREILLKQLIDLNNTVAHIYHQELKNIKISAPKYLEERNINTTSVHSFLLGGSPIEQNFLSNKIDLSQFHKNVLVASQLFYINKENYEDRFRNKIIFPIQDIKGNIIAFGSRVLDNSLPKYINSAETPLFKKRQTLYGLFQAKETIKQKDSVFITEGYFDVIAMHQENLTNTVATLGTAITVQHIQVIKQYTENITLLFDGDTAGEKAAMKALWICLEEGISPQFILCPDGQDPFDLCQQYKSNMYQWLEKNNRKWSEFLLLKISQEKNPIKQQKMVKDYLQQLEKINPFLSQSFAVETSEFFKIPINTFLKQKYEHNIYKKNNTYIKKPSFQQQYSDYTPNLQNQEEFMENFLVCLCIFSPNDFYQLQEKIQISSEFFSTPIAKQIFASFLNENAFILQDFLEKSGVKIVSVIKNMEKHILSIENKSKALLDTYYSLQLLSLTQQEQAIKKSIEDNSLEKEELLLAFKELEFIIQKQKQLKKHRLIADK